MQCYDPRHRESILKQLAGKNCALNDTSVINLLYLLYQLRGTLPITMIDPLAIRPLAQKGRLTSHLNLGKSSLTFLPLVDAHHWSLLVLIPSLSVYLHLDSIQGYHHKYAHNLLVTTSTVSHYKEMAFHKGASQQESTWECGFFMLMNAFMFIAMKEASLQSEETLRCYMQRHLSTIREGNVRRFADKLHHIVSEIKYMDEQ